MDVCSEILPLLGKDRFCVVEWRLNGLLPGREFDRKCEVV